MIYKVEWVVVTIKGNDSTREKHGIVAVYYSNHKKGSHATSNDWDIFLNNLVALIYIIIDVKVHLGKLED